MRKFLNEIFFWTKKRRVARRSRKSPNRQKYLELKEKARNLVKNRLENYNLVYNFKFGRISVKNQRSRWGSCSKKGNLNFNFRIVELPFELADYIIVHELCHLGEFNHSKKFWALVERTIPDYGTVRKELRKIRIK